MENVRPLGLPPGLLPPQESGQARPPERPSRAEPDVRGATAGSDRITLSEEGRARARRDVGGSPVENVATGEASRAIRSYQAEAQQAPAFEPPPLAHMQAAVLHVPDLGDVKGQEGAKRALEVAAAGGHNMLFVGPPGSGKSMLAKRIAGVLPPLSFEEALETTKIHSVAGILPGDAGLVTSRPFRAPHHTISDSALVGGGSLPRPGEISLAHHGVLFLDELPEFARNVLEVLRQPLEEGRVTISRSRMTVEFPSSFMLVCAMNPCPCGFYTDPNKECTCAPPQIQRYMAKISGPLLDRIDIHIEVPAVKYKELSSKTNGEKSEEIRRRVIQARQIQLERFKNLKHVFNNGDMGSKEVRTFCKLDEQGEELLKMAMTKLGLSARAYDRILKVSRTIADLEGSENILPQHISEAIQYRSLDRELWKH